MKQLILSFCLLLSPYIHAQLNPAITCWVINPGTETGYNNIPSNVLGVQYSAANVYISCNSIPGYTIGPWPGDPWQPSAQNFVFKITLAPQQNNGPKIIAPYGHIGIWKNGVSIYNPKDAKSYEEKGVWFQNAFYFENTTFDDCLGHPNGIFEYHTHVNPRCVYTVTDSSQHAPIIGYAFDGFPIYGAWGFANTNGSGGIKRMRTSYRQRNITDRTTLPDGTILADTLFGPPLSTYPIGAYIEDYEYVQSLGDLDEHNGRFCVTPDYPNGIYAYFVTVDDALEPIYPYVLGPRYYGKVQPGNLGPNSGQNVVNEDVQIFTSLTSMAATAKLHIYPNPAQGIIYIDGEGKTINNIRLYNTMGQLVKEENNFGVLPYALQLNECNAGVYYLQVTIGKQTLVTKLVVTNR